MQSTKPHAVLFSSPGMGHLIPVLELGQTLVNHQDFEATIFVVSSDSSVANSKEILRSPNPDKLRIVSLPQVDLSPFLDASAPLGVKLGLSMSLSVPNLRTAIASMNVQPTVMIVDLFGTEAFAVANEFNMLKYVFITTGAWFLAVMLHTPFLDLKAKDDHVIRREPLRIPGCEPVRFEDTFEIFDEAPNAFPAVQGMARGMLAGDGILVNSFEDLEPTSLKALRDIKIFGGSGLIPVQSIGPLVRGINSTVREKNHELLSWLDLQPPKSVVYVSFGSGGTLSARQMEEFAWGLELSGQKFIWVIRPPADNLDSFYFDHVGVAVRLRPTNGVVSREEISKAVRLIMTDEEGKSIRTRMENLKKVAKKALSDGGSSNISLSKFANDCRINLQKAHGA
ncbi:hypothetical protein ACFE04_002032 [Oxalis oulophora]